MFLNARIRSMIFHGETQELIALIPNSTTGATRQALIRNIFRRKRKILAATWPTS